MNLLDAVKTGKPIKRQSWADYLTIQNCNCASIGRKHYQCPKPSLAFPDYVEPRLTADDLLADDWEFQAIDPADALKEVEQINSAIFDLEAKYPLGCKERDILFDVRRVLGDVVHELKIQSGIRK